MSRLARRARLAQHADRLRVRRNFRLATTPPPTDSWGRFGRSWVVPPIRVSDPGRVFIGDGVIIHENVWFSIVPAFDGLDGVEARLVIDDGVRIGRGSQLSMTGELRIGRQVVIGDFVHVADTFHPYQARLRAPAVAPPRPVAVEARAVLASHVTVLPGVTIGQGAVVDHHAVVTRDVPPGTRVAGNPARPI